MVRARAGASTVLVALSLSGPRAHAQAEPAVAAGADIPQDDEYADTDPSALTDFRPALDPHGTWGDDPVYGTVWTPDPSEVGADFAPYETAGHWDYVAGDYSWVSDYAWGWVCFHYGRWAWSSGRWLWIAGHLYAGAWVSWRLGDSEYPYLGWAPMPPSWLWIGGGAYAVAYSSWEPWAFAPYQGVVGPGLASRIVVGEPAAPLVEHTRPYLAANPTVAGNAAGPPARPVPHAPPPAMLGIDVTRLPRPSLDARETRARLYAHPSSAVPLGAHPPAPHVFRVPPPLTLPRARPGAGVGPGAGARGGAGRGRR
jgi:hypothetical protein